MTSTNSERAGWGSLAARVAFASAFLVAGVGHFAATGFFLKVMPTYIPYPRAMVLLSGAIEIALGVLLLIPRTSRLAAWGLVALLIAVFPANVHVYLHQELFPPFPYSHLIHLLRLPFQGVLIYWAYTFTHSPGPSRGRELAG